MASHHCLLCTHVLIIVELSLLDLVHVHTHVHTHTYTHMYTHTYTHTHTHTSPPKTRKGRRYLEERSPKVVENTKRVMLIKGGQTSEVVSQALRDLVSVSIV